MGSSHTRHKSVGGGAGFDRGGAVVMVGKMSLDAAMVGCMVSVEDDEMGCDAAIVTGTVAVEAS